ncbi:hypothetical protein HNQ64_000991 [Prosthecobacter dejongeii]|uniref:Uncharacterized protein n=1 Tax=Prosthecobacter dejongeii TaxID=48465 RepID=A0A7W7YIN7_9BACT|nr:hypothetical protein [Prosthecobacter dejongeii]
MDQHFAPLIDRDLASCLNGLSLGFVAGSEALVSGTPDRPAVL